MRRPYPEYQIPQEMYCPDYRNTHCKGEPPVLTRANM